MYGPQGDFCKPGKGFSSWVSSGALLLWLCWEVFIAQSSPSIRPHLIKGLLSHSSSQSSWDTWSSAPLLMQCCSRDRREGGWSAQDPQPARGRAQSRSAPSFCSLFQTFLFFWHTPKLILQFVNLNKPFNEACLDFGFVKKFETKARLRVGVCCAVKISHACFPPHLFSRNSTAQRVRKLQVLLDGPVYKKKVVRVAGIENGFSRVYESYHFLWESTFLAESIPIPTHTIPLFLLQWSCVSKNLALCIC